MAKRLISTCLLALLSLSAHISTMAMDSKNKLTPGQEVALRSAEKQIKPFLEWGVKHPILAGAGCGVVIGNAVAFPVLWASNILGRVAARRKIKALENQVKVLNQNSAKKNTQQSTTPSKASVETAKK